MSDEHNKEKQIHRRDVLKWGAVAGAAVAVGASIGGLAPLFKPAPLQRRMMKKGS